MASESSDLSVESQLQNFPLRSECTSLEEFQEKTKKCYEQYGLRLPTDFSEDEKKAIVEDCTVKLIDPKVLSKKYNTAVFAIRHFAYEKGLKLAPEDLSKYPDYPKKSADMSTEEYQNVLKKYWSARKKRLKRANKQKAKSEIKANPMKEADEISLPPPKTDIDIVLKEDFDMASDASNLSAITKIQNFPIRSQCMSSDEFHEKKKNYHEQHGLRILLGIKVKALNETGGIPLSPDLSKYPDFPLKKDNISIEEFEESVNKYLRDKKKGKEKKKEKERIKQQKKRKRREERNQMDMNTIMNY